MGNEQVDSARGGMLPRSGSEPFVASGSNEAAAADAPSCEFRQDASAAACNELCARCESIGVHVSYAGECSIEETVSRYLAARDDRAPRLPDRPDR